MISEHFVIIKHQNVHLRRKHFREQMNSIVSLYCETQKNVNTRILARTLFHCEEETNQETKPQAARVTSFWFSNVLAVHPNLYCFQNTSGVHQH